MLLKNREINKENYITYIVPIEQEFMRKQEEDRLRSSKYKTKSKSVKSSSIYSVGYDQDKEIMDIIFNTSKNKIYRYFNVSKKVFESLINADSIGKYYRQDIMGFYESIKIEIES